MKKNNYETPDIRLIYLLEEDLIATSGLEDGEEEDDNNFNDGYTKPYGGR